jgi:hypothetical protein
MSQAIFLCLLVAAPDADSWVKYAPDRGGFSVLIPGKPTESSQHNEAAEVDFAEAVLEKGPCRYVAMFSRLPKMVLDSLPPDAVLDLMTMNFRRNEASPSEVTKTGAGKNSVRELIVESKDAGQTSWTKVCLRLVNNNLVVLQISAKGKADLTSTEATKFFDSFQRTDN